MQKHINAKLQIYMLSGHDENQGIYSVWPYACYTTLDLVKMDKKPDQIVFTTHKLIHNP